MTENYVQGLQWVLFYYYRGVASWGWFYGYHYAPMISDVKKGLGADVNFKLGQPFRPYQQLMGVLPDRSKKIVPTVYHDLMTNPDSPIIDFYPRDFELDMNGKKMEWEAVVKIPFIDEKRLLGAMATRDGQLSPDEVARNEFGVSLKFTYAPEMNYTYPSSLPGVFPDLNNCKCVENIFELPTMDGLDVYVGLIEGVKLGDAALAGFPSLRTLPHTGTLGFHGVSVFQQESRNESMVVTLMNSDKTCGIEYAKLKLGKAVHVGYPFLQEAKVTCVSDELCDYSLADPNAEATPANIEILPHGPQEISNWRKKANRIEGAYSKRLGTVIGDVESLIHVNMLVGLRKTDEGATIKQYSTVEGLETDYATQTIVDSVISEDQRFLERAALPFDEEFPTESRVFFLGEFNYGRPSVVQGHVDNKATLLVSTVAAKEVEFGREIASFSEQRAPYKPAFAVARALGLHPLVLSKLTASFRVNSSGLQLNLGLNLKFEARKMKVLGYSRKSERGWEFSQKAQDLIAGYVSAFPEFVARIQANPSGDVFNDTDFYPEEVAKQKMKEIGAWLKSVETKSFERVPLDAEQMDSETVMAIERAADYYQANSANIVNKKIGGIPRNALLKPSDAEQRVGNQRFTLGDRIVYVADSGRVPIASRGTVVGVTRTPRTVLLDIVFDSTFISGTTLGERCSPFRGSTVPVTSVLNLTDKQAIAQTRAGAERAPAQSYAPLTTASNGYGAPAAAGGGGQLREAPAPGPLRGSFRGAVAGIQANGTRGGRGRGGPQDLPILGGPPGRGGPNGFRGRGRGDASGFVPRGRGGGGRGGYNVVDNSDPSEGVVRNNPNFRPQNYSNVPPPANLDSPRGGRGRGRGVARGPRGGRGRGAPAVDGAAE